MKHSKSSSELGSLETTRTMREKAQVFGRCLINIMKFWRLCFSKKSIKRQQTQKDENATSTRHA